MTTPSYSRDQVKVLAADPDRFEMYRCAADDALGFGLDSDDIREVFQRIDEWTFLKKEPTEKYHPGTISDYYIYFVEECLTRMFIKFLVAEGVLVVTSFKEDDNG